MIVRGRNGLAAVLLGFAAMLLLGSFPLAAQEPSGGKPVDSKAPATAAKKTYDPSRRVPPLFGQVGLSQDQKEDIYKVRAKYLEKIDALQKQMDQVRAEMMADCESKLTDGQKQLLAARRRSAAESRKSQAAKSETAPNPKTVTTEKG